MTRITPPTAGARVCGPHQHSLAREAQRLFGASDQHLTALQRLPQLIQHRATKFRQLIEKQHAVMGQGELTRPGAKASTHQGCCSTAVVRRPPGRLVQQRSSSRSQTHHGVDVAHHQGLLVIQGRQQPQQGRGQHRFAAPGWSHQQQVMAAGRRHFHGAASLALAQHLLQINRH